jgi:3-hydroxyacyl-[acyl-carrier-protein] dehydratase
MVESLAQLGGIAVLLDERYAGKLPLFGGSNGPASGARSFPVTRSSSGDLDHMSARAGKGHGIGSVGGQKACEADLLFVIVDGGAN